MNATPSQRPGDFEHRPQTFVTVLDPRTLIIGVADRAAFDRIGAPLQDHGETDRGHCLTKAIEATHPSSGDVCVVFQFWLWSLTHAAFIARHKHEAQS